MIETKMENEDDLDDPIKLIDFEQRRVSFESGNPTETEIMEYGCDADVEIPMSYLVDPGIRFPLVCEHLSEIQPYKNNTGIKASSVKLVDCMKFPSYYTKYKHQLWRLKSKRDLNQEYSEVIDLDKEKSVQDQTKLKSNSLELSKNQEEIKTINLINNFFVVHKGLKHIDFKRNIGLVGLTIKRNLRINKISKNDQLSENIIKLKVDKNQDNMKYKNKDAICENSLISEKNEEKNKNDKTDIKTVQNTKPNETTTKINSSLPPGSYLLSRLSTGEKLITLVKPQRYDNNCNKITDKSRRSKISEACTEKTSHGSLIVSEIVKKGENEVLTKSSNTNTMIKKLSTRPMPKCKKLQLKRQQKEKKHETAKVINIIENKLITGKPILIGSKLPSAKKYRAPSRKVIKFQNKSENQRNESNKSKPKNKSCLKTLSKLSTNHSTLNSNNLVPGKLNKVHVESFNDAHLNPPNNIRLGHDKSCLKSSEMFCQTNAISAKFTDNLIYTVSSVVNNPRTQFIYANNPTTQSYSSSNVASTVLTPSYSASSTDCYPINNSTPSGNPSNNPPSQSHFATNLVANPSTESRSVTNLAANLPTESSSVTNLVKTYQTHPVLNDRNKNSNQSHSGTNVVPHSSSQFSSVIVPAKMPSPQCHSAEKRKSPLRQSCSSTNIANILPSKTSTTKLGNNFPTQPHFVKTHHSSNPSTQSHPTTNLGEKYQSRSNPTTNFPNKPIAQSNSASVRPSNILDGSYMDSNNLNDVPISSSTASNPSTISNAVSEALNNTNTSFYNELRAKNPLSENMESGLFNVDPEIKKESVDAVTVIANIGKDISQNHSAIDDVQNNNIEKPLPQHIQNEKENQASKNDQTSTNSIKNDNLSNNNKNETALQFNQNGNPKKNVENNAASKNNERGTENQNNIKHSIKDNKNSNLQNTSVGSANLIKDVDQSESEQYEVKKEPVDSMTEFVQNMGKEGQQRSTEKLVHKSTPNTLSQNNRNIIITKHIDNNIISANIQNSILQNKSENAVQSQSGTQNDNNLPRAFASHTNRIKSAEEASFVHDTTGKRQNVICIKKSIPMSNRVCNNVGNRLSQYQDSFQNSQNAMYNNPRPYFQDVSSPNYSQISQLIPQLQHDQNYMCGGYYEGPKGNSRMPYNNYGINGNWHQPYYCNSNVRFPNYDYLCTRTEPQYVRRPNVVGKKVYVNVKTGKKVGLSSDQHSIKTKSNDIVNSRSEMLQELDRTISAGSVNGNPNNIPVALTDNVSNMVSVKPTTQSANTNLKYVPRSQGYSPPVLPIPNYVNVLSRVELNDTPKKRGRKPKEPPNNPISDNPANTDSKGNKRRLTLDEYKKRPINQNGPKNV